MKMAYFRKYSTVIICALNQYIVAYSLQNDFIGLQSLKFVYYRVSGL